MKEVKTYKVVLGFWDLEVYNQIVFGNLILVVLDKMDGKMYLIE